MKSEYFPYYHQPLPRTDISHEEEIALFAALRAGDGDARDRLIMLHRPYIVRVVNRMVTRPSDREDAIGTGNEVMMGLIDNEFFDPHRGRFKNFLYWPLFHALNKMFRLRSGVHYPWNSTLPDSGLDFFEMNEGDLCAANAVHHFDHTEIEKSELVKAIAELPPEEKQIISQHYLDEVPIAQIAEERHQSRSHVNQKKNGGLTQLEFWLGDKTEPARLSAVA
jgi:RNA polymerase sporulation-specific sigma factor